MSSEKETTLLNLSNLVRYRKLNKMWCHEAIQLTIILLTLLQLQSHQMSAVSAAAAAAVGVAPSSISIEAKIESKHTSPTDSYNVRHGRSKVRRSNEKEYILWSLRPTQNGPRATNSVATKSRAIKIATSTTDGRSGGGGGIGDVGRRSGNITTKLMATQGQDNAAQRSSSMMSAGLTSNNEYIDTAADGSVKGHSNNKRPVSSHRWSSETVSSIETGNGHLFGSDYWRNSDANGTLLNAPEISYSSRAFKLKPSLAAMTQTRYLAADEAPIKMAQRTHRAGKHKRVFGVVAAAAKATTDTLEGSYGSFSPTTEAPQPPATHRIRKLHMKKIMESIRNLDDNSRRYDGSKLMKNHYRSLVAAEQMQGRPMDVELKQPLVVVSDVRVTESSKHTNQGMKSIEQSIVEEDDDEDDDDGDDGGGDDDIFNSGSEDQEIKDHNENGSYEIGYRLDGAGGEDVSESESESESESIEDDLSSNAVDNEAIANNNNADSEPTNAELDSNSGELNEVLKLADELDEAGGGGSLEYAYQNDEYITTSPTYVSTKSFDDSAEFNEPTEESTTHMVYVVGDLVTSEPTETYINDMILESTTRTPIAKALRKISKTHKTRTTKLQLIPKSSTKTVATTKLTLLPDSISAKEFAHEKLDVKHVQKNPSNRLAPQNQIAVRERPTWEADGIMPIKDQEKKVDAMRNEFAYSSEALYPSDMERFESVETSNETAGFNDSETQNNTNPHYEGLAELPNITPYRSSEMFALAAGNHSHEPSQLASTSVGGSGGLSRQQSYDIGEINFENIELENPNDITMDDGHMDNRNAHGFPVSNSADTLSAEDGNETDGDGNGNGVGGDAEGDGDDDETNRFLAGVIDAANEDEIYDWDEISRNNRRNLMRGRDVVTKFLQIVETQHLLGANCEAGTSLNLGEGVVDRYAQDRFRVEAEVAVNRANMLTR